MSNNKVILYGMRGTWKSTVWKLLAKELGYDFLDLDNFIAEQNKRKLSEYIESEWWDEFRDEEHRCLKEVLEQDDNEWRVISLWWWTITFERNRDELYQDKNTKIIYLDTHLGEIAKRILKDEQSWDSRNSLTGKSVLEELKEVFEERKKIYKNSCDFSVDNNWVIDKTIAEIAYKLTWWGICIPITDFSNISKIYEDIKSDRRIEYVELRIDFLTDYSWLEGYILQCPKKIICTNRASFEWWEFSWTLEQSIDLLQKCISYGTDYIDIELETFEKIDAKNRANINTKKLILSHHYFQETPQIVDLQNVLESMKELSPAVYKIACMPKNASDVGKIYELYEYFHQKINSKSEQLKNVFISMWELWISTRIHWPSLWALFTFWSYWNSTSAPWQIHYADLYKKIYDSNKLFWKTIENYELQTCSNLEKVIKESNSSEWELLDKIYENINIFRRVLFLWASQISGSFSPFIHNFSSMMLKKDENKFFYWITPVFQWYDSPENIVTEFIQYLENNDRFLWANVTMPYKIDMYNYLCKNQYLDIGAEMVWAVNTIYKKDWKLRATNTDIDGMKLPILEKLWDWINNVKHLYILWSWWAARAWIWAAIQIWIPNIYILARKQESLDELYNDFSKYLWEEQKLITKIYDVSLWELFPIQEAKDKLIIVNTLPFWFKNNLPKSPIDFGNLEKLYSNIELYYEIIYDAGKWDTPIVQEIEKYNSKNKLWKSIKICRWVEMLIAQAQTWFELWSGWGEFQKEKLKKILLN